MTESINKISDNMIKEVCNMNKNTTKERSIKDLRNKASEAFSDEFSKLGVSVSKETQNALVNLAIRAHFLEEKKKV